MVRVEEEESRGRFGSGGAKSWEKEPRQLNGRIAVAAKEERM